MSDLGMMNEAMYECLGEIAKFASNKRVELDPDFKGDKSDETQNRLMLAAFRELRSMVEFYKPEEKEPVIPGCPSLKPLQLPGGFDGTEPGEDDDFFKIGDAPILYVNSVRTTCIKCVVNGRKFCVEIFRVDPVGCEIFLYDNGEPKMNMKSIVGRKAMTYVAFAMLKSYVRHLDSRRFLKKAAKNGGAK